MAARTVKRKLKNNKKPYYCGYCSRRFKNVLGVKYHTKRMHNKDLKVLSYTAADTRICPHCKLHMLYSKFLTFINHLKLCLLNEQRKASGSAKPYVCRNCPRVSKICENKNYYF